MFCSQCGKELPESSNFCPSCGFKIGGKNNNQTDFSQRFSTTFNTINNTVNAALSDNENEITEKWIWALATLPIFIGGICRALLGQSMLITIIIIALNIVFLTLDVRELKQKGQEVSQWLFLGLILVPIYLFVRESKTNRNKLPGIVWCVLAVLDYFIWNV